DGFIELIDQRQLPGKFVKLQCRDVQSIGKAIKTLAVRGAPATLTRIFSNYKGAGGQFPVLQVRRSGCLKLCRESACYDDYKT
ncbi:MAG: hypothetical protein JXB29_06145, partial [Sedimentisphaerales bacterium]|nr:hypothetical protein [Sedimentisphaerales bacterium]